MLRSKTGKFQSKKSFVKQFKAQESRRNILVSHPVDEPITADHNYVHANTYPVFSDSDLELGASCTIDPSLNNDWKTGRRVVELQALAQQMFCTSCDARLHLADIESERRYGLGSILFIRCQNSVCSSLNDVKTGKRNNGTFDINSKLALAMVHTGMGPVQINNFLATLNLPPVVPSTLKRREQKIDTTLETVAKKSCLEAQKEEIEKGNGKMEVSFDGGWQKRGTGWNYNSNTGHASLIGKETGKVLQFSLRSKSCQICALHQSKNHTIPVHECSKNWDGSSKAMEPDMAISMARELEETGCAIDVIHGDNDSTTTSRLKAVFPSIEKKDDSNHTKKGITSKLYKLSHKYKVLKQPNVISYIGRCFMYAIKECQTKEPESLRKSLDIIVPHLYGDHSLCASEDATWCSYQKNPSQFRYRSLPQGKPLTCPSLQTDLKAIVNSQKDRAACLTNLGSTQANENFNFIVSTKAPKNKSFGSSKSLTGRISASVLQKNEGHKYLEKVNKAVGLSPGEFTFRMALKIAAKRKLQKAKQISLQAKRKRLLKKILKSKKEATKEIHEGVTYYQAAELHLDEELTQTTEIPNRLTLPENAFTYVVFDTETTGRGRNSDILQIAAGDDFNVYAQPRCEISEQASAVNMLRYDRGTNTMFHRGIPVLSKPIQEALLDFIAYLKKVPQPILCDVGNYKQENLVSKLTNCTYQAHDAKEDVRVLTTLFTEKIEKEVLDEDLFHISFHDVKKRYDEILQQKFMSLAAVTKLARNGVSPLHLRLAHNRNSGLKLLLTDLHIRLTNKNLTSVISFLEKEE
ncbi:uncharacterized protein LOC134714327 [Mytilus trossulus]|uniref:uncharacterized protein LOC134714327 n=1 Tax=Mytilus trossulus TaxID=6551 RepID=UPI003006CAC8